MTEPRLRAIGASVPEGVQVLERGPYLLGRCNPPHAFRGHECKLVQPHLRITEREVPVRVDGLDFPIIATVPIDALANGRITVSRHLALLHLSMVQETRRCRVQTNSTKRFCNSRVAYPEKPLWERTFSARCPWSDFFWQLTSCNSRGEVYPTVLREMLRVR